MVLLNWEKKIKKQAPSAQAKAAALARYQDRMQSHALKGMPQPHADQEETVFIPGPPIKAPFGHSSFGLGPRPPADDAEAFPAWLNHSESAPVLRTAPATEAAAPALATEFFSAEFAQMPELASGRYTPTSGPRPPARQWLLAGPAQPPPLSTPCRWKLSSNDSVMFQGRRQKGVPQNVHRDPLCLLGRMDPTPRTAAEKLREKSFYEQVVKKNEARQGLHGGSMFNFSSSLLRPHSPHAGASGSRPPSRGQFLIGLQTSLKRGDNQHEKQLQQRPLEMSSGITSEVHAFEDSAGCKTEPSNEQEAPWLSNVRLRVPRSPQRPSRPASGAGEQQTQVPSPIDAQNALKAQSLAESFSQTKPRSEMESSPPPPAQASGSEMQMSSSEPRPPSRISGRYVAGGALPRIALP